MAVNGDSGHGRRTQAQRSAATRAALMAAARTLFAERGFAGTAREDVVERAGVTRGALQHHFGGKEGLFLAVVHTLEMEQVERIMVAASGAAGAMDELRRGCGAFLDSAMDPAMRHIVLLDAPAVLGWQAWREIEATYGLGLVIEVIRAAMEEGSIERRPVDPLAHLLLGALNEAALLVANSDDPATTRAEVGTEVDRLLDSLTRVSWFTSGVEPDPSVG